MVSAPTPDFFSRAARCFWSRNSRRSGSCSSVFQFQAMAPGMWFLGLGAMVALLLLTGNPFLLIFVLLGGMETWRRWKQRKTRSLEQAAYYRVSPRNRLLVAAVYIGLIAALAFGMYETHILESAGHSFRSV